MAFSNSRISMYGHEEGNMQEEEFDFNKFATKKTVSKGLLNFGLFSSNVLQLVTTIDVGKSHRYYYENIAFILASLALQIIVMILLMVLGCNKGKEKEEQKKAEKLNNVATGIVSFIAVINLFITFFSAAK